jgi:hypothetical protein
LLINFVNPTVLLGILKNVSLQLPSSHTLIADIRSENIHLYYELIKVSIIATPHNLKLLLNVPLKTTGQRFTLFKIITLPERISSGKFVQYFVDYAYFDPNDNQHDYFLYTEAQHDNCAKHSMVICPANTVIFNSHTLTCEAILFFQNTNSAHLYKRKILLHHQTPTLLQHADLWIHFYPERHQVTFRCPNANNQAPRTTQLISTGLIHGLSKCYISSTHLRTQPELYGLLKAKPDVTSFYLPGNLSSITDHETRQLDDVIPADTTRIDNITSRLAAHRQMLDLDSVLIMHQSSSQKEQQTHRLILIATSIITAIILTIICYLLYSSGRKLQCYSVAAISSPNTCPSTPPLTTECPQRDTDEQKVTFTSYLIPDAGWRRTDATTLAIIYRRVADTAIPPVL